MTFDPDKIAYFKRYDSSDGSGFSFFCQLSGALVYVTVPMTVIDEDEALAFFWEKEAKHEFNQCTQCGRWVSDMMFNADVLKCVDCAPWENKPRYCPHCGNEVCLEDKFCTQCGGKLQYGV